VSPCLLKLPISFHPLFFLRVIVNLGRSSVPVYLSVVKGPDFPFFRCLFCFCFSFLRFFHALSDKPSFQILKPPLFILNFLHWVFLTFYENPLLENYLCLMSVISYPFVASIYFPPTPSIIGRWRCNAIVTAFFFPPFLGPHIVFLFSSSLFATSPQVVFFLTRFRLLRLFLIHSGFAAVIVGSSHGFFVQFITKKFTLVFFLSNPISLFFELFVFSLSFFVWHGPTTACPSPPDPPTPTVRYFPPSSIFFFESNDCHFPLQAACVSLRLPPPSLVPLLCPWFCESTLFLSYHTSSSLSFMTRPPWGPPISVVCPDDTPLFFAFCWGSFFSCRLPIAVPLFVLNSSCRFPVERAAFFCFPYHPFPASPSLSCFLDLFYPRSFVLFFFLCHRDVSHFFFPSTMPTLSSSFSLDFMSFLLR